MCNRRLEVRKQRKGEEAAQLCEVEAGAHSQVCKCLSLMFFPDRVNCNCTRYLNLVWQMEHKLIYLISVRGQVIPEDLEWQGFLIGFVKAGHGRQNPFHSPSQRQGSWGAEMGSWTVGRVGGAQVGLGRDSKAPQGPGRLLPSKAVTSELPYLAFALTISPSLMSLSFLAIPWQHGRWKVIQSKTANSL